MGLNFENHRRAPKIYLVLSLLLFASVMSCENKSYFWIIFVLLKSYLVIVSYKGLSSVFFLLCLYKTRLQMQAIAHKLFYNLAKSTVRFLALFTIFDRK